MHSTFRRTAIKIILQYHQKVKRSTMKIISIGVLLCLCLVSSQARPGIRSPKPENVNENDRFPAEISHFGVFTGPIKCYMHVTDCNFDYLRTEEWWQCCNQVGGLSYIDERQGNRCLVW